jgi:hypothetical protein
MWIELIVTEPLLAISTSAAWCWRAASHRLSAHPPHGAMPRSRPACFPRAALVAFGRFTKERLDGRHIAPRAQPEVDRPARPVNATVQVAPLASDLDVGLIDPPWQRGPIGDLAGQETAAPLAYLALGSMRSTRWWAHKVGTSLFRLARSDGGFGNPSGTTWARSRLISMIRS